MPEITVETLYNQIVQLPQTERFRLRGMLDQVKEGEPARQEQANLPQPEKRLQPVPMPDSTRELQWLADHGREYAGQWVALDGDRLIAHSANADKVFAAANADGAYLPMIGFVDDPDKVYAGF